MEEPKAKVGDKVKLKMTRYERQFEFTGIIRQVRNNFGRVEYLVGDIESEPFWVRTVEHAK